MKKNAAKPNLLVELITRKMEAQNSGETAESFEKFKSGKPRNAKKSPVGPARGGRKGN